LDYISFSLYSLALCPRFPRDIAAAAATCGEFNSTNWILSRWKHREIDVVDASASFPKTEMSLFVWRDLDKSRVIAPRPFVVTDWLAKSIPMQGNLFDHPNASSTARSSRVHACVEG